MNDVRLSSDHVLNRVQQVGLLVGVVALAACVVGAFQEPREFFRSYLIGYMFWLGISLGSMTILMIHHVAGGVWSAVTRRIVEASSRLIPFMAILFLPILFLGVHELYEWSHEDVVAKDAILQAKKFYLNTQFFTVRAIFFFVAWSSVAFYLNRWSLQQDETGDLKLGTRMELLSRGGLVLLVLTLSFATVDWMMSLEPHWFSTIYGVLIFGGQLLGSMAFVIIIANTLAGTKDAPLAKVVGKKQFHDLGKLMFGFTLVWTYFTLSQFLIIWSANLPEEIPWYLNRTSGGWQYLIIGIVFFQFVLPFAMLLSRELTRSPGKLAAVAVLVMVTRLVDYFWLITPAFHPGQFAVHWMDFLAPIGVGGIWLFLFVQQLKNRSLVAANDLVLLAEVK